MKIEIYYFFAVLRFNIIKIPFHFDTVSYIGIKEQNLFYIYLTWHTWCHAKVASIEKKSAGSNGNQICVSRYRVAGFCGHNSGTLISIQSNFNYSLPIHGNNKNFSIFTFINKLFFKCNIILLHAQNSRKKNLISILPLIRSRNSTFS